MKPSFEYVETPEENGRSIAMDSKKSVGVKTFWYTDILVIPKLVTIVTTINGDGIVNAVPYSLGTPYNLVEKKPQMLLGMQFRGRATL